MNYLKRAWLMLRRQGLRPLARAAFRHFVHLRWNGAVFQDDPGHARPRSSWPAGYRFELWDTAATIGPAARAAMGRAAGPDFLLGLGVEDGVYGVWFDGEIVAYGAVFRRSPQRDVLGLPEAAILIGGCFTLQAHRRLGLYRSALNDTARQLRPRHGGSIFIEARPENKASIAGIRSAGFVDRGVVHSAVWFGAMVHREGRWHRLRRESHV
jgi:hypothetical protein